MKPGDVYEVYCPSQFAYGSHETYSHFGSETIPKNSDLRMEVELMGCTRQNLKQIEKKKKKKEVAEEIQKDDAKEQKEGPKHKPTVA